MNKIDLTEVAERVKDLDVFERTFMTPEKMSKASIGKAYGLMALYEKLNRQVGIAFAEATRDRNNFDTAKLVRAGSKYHYESTWLRKMLQKDGLYSGLGEEDGEEETDSNTERTE